jgi:predicted phage terminase large subunit-like protein
MAKLDIARGPRLQASEVGARAERLLRGNRPEDRMTKEQRIERGRADFQWFCRYYLADYFSCEPAEFHKELSELVDTQEKVVAAAPREHAKSTVVSFAKVLHSICYKLAHFIVLFRESDDVAQQNTNDIRQELESNDRINEDFGFLYNKRKWAEGEFVTSTGIKVVARGRGSSARGLRYKQWRPDLVIVDDIEDDELVESKQQRDKLERWFKRVVSNIVGPGGRLFVIGTILHHDSLLSRLLRTEGIYVTRLWRAIKADGKPLWPARWPASRLEAKRKELGARDFATEFMNDAANEEEQIFAADKKKYFRDRDLDGLELDLVAAIDPAIGQKAKNDDTARAVVGGHGGNYYVLGMVIRKLKIQNQVELVLSTCREWPGIRKFGFETIAYQDALKQLVEEESARANLQIPAVAVADISSDKLKRISRLAPLWEQGRIIWPSASSSYWSPDVQKCIDEFESLGCSANAHDDGPDAVERAIALLRGSRGRKGSVRML